MLKTYLNLPLVKLTLVVFIAFLLWQGLNPGTFQTLLEVANTWLFASVGWVYLLFANACLVFAVALGFTPWGKLRLGGPQAQPAYNSFTWLAMLFSAGMGTGLLFWGAAEPLYHSLYPPIAGDATLVAQQARALELTMFHWGVHPWAIYAISAIMVGVLAFNKKASFWPSQWFSNKPNQWWMRALDGLTIAAILVGIAASFATGVLQIEAGLNLLTGIPETQWLQGGLIIVMAGLFMLSAMSGLGGSIPTISRISVYLAVLLMLAVFIRWPLDPAAIGSWLGALSLTDAWTLSWTQLNFTPPSWPQEWTLKYWSWWIAWAPFVGLFVAITSYGRTLKTIAWWGTLLPALGSMAWYLIFGNAALFYQANTGSLEQWSQWDTLHHLLFELLNGFGPWAPVLQILSLLLAAGFFINSADSATYTLAFLTQTDKPRKDTPAPKPGLKVIWGLVLTTLAAVFLFTGELALLQQVTLLSAFPLTIILTACIWQLVSWLWSHSHKEQAEDDKLQIAPSSSQAVT